MRYYPGTPQEMQETLEEYACEAWMIEELRRNPGYCNWGPREDCQWIEETDDPNSPRQFSTWAHFKRCFTVGKHPETTADRSGGEIVNWYFQLDRLRRVCSDCKGSGLNLETKKLWDEWYSYPPGDGWQSRLEQDEIDALVEHGRLRSFVEMPTLSSLEDLVAEGKIDRAEADARWERRDKSKDRIAGDGVVSNHTVRWRDHVPAEEVNAQKSAFSDQVTQHICVEVRAKRLGVYGLCPTCEGEGCVFVERRGRLSMVFWCVNPRTGQNYGIDVRDIDEGDLPEIYEFVRTCGQRLADHLDLLKDLNFTTSSEAGWTRPGSCLDGDPAYPTSWRAPISEKSWKTMRHVRDWDGTLVSPEHPRYAKLEPSWSLDSLNELIGIYFEPQQEILSGRAHFWIAHPRKGASRRLTVASYTEEDVPEIVAWVRKARDRTLERFACKPRE